MPKPKIPTTKVVDQRKKFRRKSDFYVDLDKMITDNLNDYLILSNLELINELQELSTLWVSLLKRFTINYGKIHSVKILKEVYNEIQRYSLGLNIRPCTSTWIKRDKDNFPKVLKPFKIYLNPKSSKMTWPYKRVILSILRSVDLIQCEPVIDFSTIESTSDGASNWAANHKEQFGYFIERSPFMARLKQNFQKNLDIIIEENLKEHNYHYSNRRGVYGSTFQEIGKDTKALLESDKLSVCKQIAYQLGIDDFESTVENSTCDVDLNHNSIGRLSFISDKACKTRVVALGNYWIQDILKDIHVCMFKTLKSLPTDGTYKQNDAAKAVGQASMYNDVWSYDLTSATDRIPLSVQGQIMEFLDEDLGKLWYELMQEFPYYHNGSKRTITYAVGQGMGLYSSWSNLAFFNHIMIQYSQYLYNIDIKRHNIFYYTNKYRVLGDDVAIWNKGCAKKYKYIIQEILEIPISEHKSFEPISYLKNRIAEFAKRIFIDGTEVTPIPPVILKESFRHVVDMPNLLDYKIKTEEHTNFTIPGRAIYDIFTKRKLSKNKINMLFVLIQIRAMFTGYGINYKEIPIVEATDLDKQYCLSFDPSNINVNNFISIRSDKLLDQINKSFLNDEVHDEFIGQLTKYLGKQPNDDSIYYKIINTVKKDLSRCREKLYELAFTSTTDENEEDRSKIESFFGFETKEPIELLSEIEFLPMLNDEMFMPSKKSIISPKLARRKLFSWTQDFINTSPLKEGYIVTIY
nr:TPA_asm: RNA-dependent polymerase [Despoena mito-like virus]|mmetsp:Transcript_12434/g.31402  ORF Transcript_12434/g.31402 Transcript_12434/m.31402 type:complete len:746 (-) Transcript_12434:35-2272(-)